MSLFLAPKTQKMAGCVGLFTRASPAVCCFCSPQATAYVHPIPKQHPRFTRSPLFEHTKRPFFVTIAHLFDYDALERWIGPATWAAAWTVREVPCSAVARRRVRLPCRVRLDDAAAMPCAALQLVAPDRPLLARLAALCGAAALAHPSRLLTIHCASYPLGLRLESFGWRSEASALWPNGSGEGSSCRATGCNR